MGKTLAIAIAAFALGAASSWLASRPVEREAPVPSSAGEPLRSRLREELREAPPPVEEPDRTVARPPPPPPITSDTTRDALVAEVEKLRAEVARQRSTAAAEEESYREQVEGRPVPRPQDLPERFAQDELRTRVTDALREAGFEGAEITSIDCTEHPCLVYGEGTGDREEFDRLVKAPSFAPYGEDSRQAFGWRSRDGDGGPGVQRFGLALFGKADAEAGGAELRKRIQHRSRQLAETFARE